MAEPRPEITPEELNRRGIGRLPGLVGLEVLEVGKSGLRGRIPLRPDLLAPNGYLHAATLIALADTLANLGGMRVALLRVRRDVDTVSDLLATEALHHVPIPGTVRRIAARGVRRDG